jgi:hypothetical protein
MMICCIFLFGSLMAVLLVIMILFKLNSRNEYYSLNESFLNLNYHINMLFSFVRIIDAKYIGLAVFGIANILTGIINILIKTHQQSTLASITIISLYMFIVVLVGFLIHKKIFSSGLNKKKPEVKDANILQTV